MINNDCLLYKNPSCLSPMRLSYPLKSESLSALPERVSGLGCAILPAGSASAGLVLLSGCVNCRRFFAPIAPAALAEMTLLLSGMVEVDGWRTKTSSK